MKYKLKPKSENFDVVDGSHAGKQYRHGKVYSKEDIPKNELHRFEAIGKSSAKLIKKMAEKGKEES